MNKKQIESTAAEIRQATSTIIFEAPEVMDGRLHFDHPPRRGHVTEQVATLFKAGAPSIRRLRADPLKGGYYAGVYDMLAVLEVLTDKPPKLMVQFLNDMANECELFFRQHKRVKKTSSKKRRSSK